MEYLYLVQILIALLSIMDPWGTIPLYLGLAAGQSDTQRRETARKAALAVFVILAICALLGKHLLAFFSIDMDSFSIAGGIYLLLMAISMLQAKALPGKSNPSEHEEAMEKEDISVVPLAMPLLAGPGAISTVILYAEQMDGVFDRSMLFVIIGLSTLVVWLCLYYARPIGDRLGRTGTNILSRIMGLVIASIAVKFIMSGLAGYGVIPA